MKMQNMIINSFGLVKKDIAAIQISFTDWVVFLKRRNDFLEQKIVALDKRVNELEQSKQIVIY